MDRANAPFPPGYNALRRGRWSESGRCYMVTTVTRNRAPFFRDIFTGRAVVREMMGLQREGLVESVAWVLMPDHLHWLLVLGRKQSLSGVIGLFKGRSARRVNQRLNRGGPLWQRAFYDHGVRKDEEVRKLARYIVANPVRAGIVERVEEYPLWDAAWL